MPHQYKIWCVKHMFSLHQLFAGFRSSCNFHHTSPCPGVAKVSFCHTNNLKHTSQFLVLPHQSENARSATAYTSFYCCTVTCILCHCSSFLDFPVHLLIFLTWSLICCPFQCPSTFTSLLLPSLTSVWCSHLGTPATSHGLAIVIHTTEERGRGATGEERVHGM